MHAHMQGSLSSAMRCLWWRSVYKTSRQLKGHFATWHTAIFHLPSPPFSSISPCVHQPQSYFHLDFLFLWYAHFFFFRFHNISIHHTESVFQPSGTLMLVCGQISSGLRKASLFFVDQIGIGVEMRTDVEGGTSSGKDYQDSCRRSSYSYNSLAGVQISALYHPSLQLLCFLPVVPFSCLPTSAWMLSNRVFLTIFSPPVECVPFFLHLSLLHIPSLPFAKTTTHTLRRPAVSFWRSGLMWQQGGRRRGRVGRAGGERELFKLATVHESSTTQRHDERERERVGVRQCGELRLYYRDVNMNTGPTDVVTWHRDKRSLFSITSAANMCVSVCFTLNSNTRLEPADWRM